MLGEPRAGGFLKQEFVESFLEEMLFEMDFNWGFHKMKKRATAFRVEGTLCAEAYRSVTAQQALAIILHDQNKDCR